MSMVCGVDGCRGGWVVVARDLTTGKISYHLARHAREILQFGSLPEVIAIDMPIGLPDIGPRDCDVMARKLLGPGRASSVFPAPIRPLLAAGSYQEASRIRRQIEGKGISKQSYAILPKVMEVDHLLRQDEGARSCVHEIHPEVCFYFLAGRHPMQHNKKKSLGHAERRNLLEPVFGAPIQAALDAKRELASAPDDILDAFVALWTAERIACGLAQTIPENPTKDAYGLRMEMVA